MEKLLQYTKLIFAFVAISFAAPSYLYALSDKPKSIKVGLIQIVEHPALDKTRQGIFDAFVKQGYVDGKTLSFRWDSAQGKFDLATQIAQKYAGQEVDVIIALGTVAAQAALSVKSNVPIVFGSVTDPVASRLVKSLEKPGRNVTGVSNFVSVEKQFAFIREVMKAKNTIRIGVIYNPGEDNSAALNKRMEEVGAKLNISVVLAAASRTCDVKAAAQSLTNKVDVMFVNNDNTALAAFNSIVEVSFQSKIPLFVSDVDIVKMGAVGAVGADQYALGKQVTDICLRILSGEDAASIPVEFPNKIEKITNDTAMKKIGLTS